jgi:hypothetical protein
MLIALRLANTLELPLDLRQRALRFAMWLQDVNPQAWQRACLSRVGLGGQD